MRSNLLGGFEESKDTKTHKEANSDNSANVAFQSTLSKTPPQQPSAKLEAGKLSFEIGAQNSNSMAFAQES